MDRTLVVKTLDCGHQFMFDNVLTRSEEGHGTWRFVLGHLPDCIEHFLFRERCVKHGEVVRCSGNFTPIEVLHSMLQQSHARC
jgi:hypothetical protein